MYPSIKTLRRVFGDNAPIARQLIDGRLSPRDATRFPKTDAFARSCYNLPSRSWLVLHALDELAGSYGVEAIHDRSGECIAEYLNQGDTYDATLLYSYVHKTDWHVTSRGDFVERYERRHGELP